MLTRRLKLAHREIQRQWVPTLPRVVIHGDLTPGNVVSFGGALKLCDPDNLKLGPREVDIAAARMHCRRIWGAHAWAEFSSAYPDTYAPGLVDALAAEKEAADCLWMAAMWDIRPECREMLAHRVDALDDAAALWADP